MKNKNFKKYILFGVGGILAISSIFMTVENATSGAEVTSLRNKQVMLANQKRELEDTLIKNISVSGLEVKSGEMGYIKPSILVYVSTSQPVAQLPQE
jgi:hypothetical protein